jgi:hypothetical protein
MTRLDAEPNAPLKHRGGMSRVHKPAALDAPPALANSLAR